MLWVPQKGALRVEHNLPAIGTAIGSIGTAVTTGASASTKGSYAEVFASTSFDAYLIEVWVWNYAATATDSQLCVDVAIGAATEEIIIPDLLCGGAHTTAGANQASMGRRFTFPLYIPAGTRITARGAGDRVSTAFRILITLWGGDGMPPFRVGSEVTTYGISTLPAGTAITPGASGAEGAWTQITASTTQDHFAVLPGYQNGLDTTKTAAGYMIDLGEGAATEEEIGRWLFSQSSGEEEDGPYPSWPYYKDIPSGTRLSMRASSSSALDSGTENGVIYAVS
jgi:hypothetical protein